MKRITMIKIVVSVLLLAASAVFISCKNPLLAYIEEDVDKAISPPEVVSIYPERDTEDVPINLSTISVTFSKYIDSSTVVSASFYVTDAGGNAISGSRKVENDTITFIPNSELEVGTEYEVTINGIKDLDGNLISEVYTWSFTTGIEGDTVRPAISGVTINNGDSWTNQLTATVEVDATDNFGIAQMNISTNGNFSDSGWITWSSSFDITFPEGDGQKTVYVKLKDGSGLESSGYGSDSIGLDTTMPEIAQFSLEGGKAGTRNSEISIDILGVDEETGSGMGDYRIRTEGGSWSDWLTLDGGSTSISDYSLSVNTNETETLYLQVRDTALNESGETSSSIVYDFTPPQVDFDLSNPVPDSTGNRTKAYVKVVFSEEMDTTTIDSTTVYVTKGIQKISTSVYEYIDDKSGIEFTEFELGGESYTLEQSTEYNVFISGTVSDVAGNAIGSDYTYSFANGAFEDNTAPEGVIVLNLDSPSVNATASATFDLEIKAEDDYNGVRAVKIWGDNIGAGFPTFEGDAAWKLYSEGGTTGGGIDYMSYNTAYASAGWELQANDGDHYIYYRFVDYANNESETPGRLKVSLDTTAPVLNGLQIDNGTGYSNNSGETVNVVIDAEDLQSGLQYMWLSVEAASALNMPSSDSGSWEAWSSLKPEVALSSGEGQYYVYAEVKDYVGNLSGLQDEGANDVYAVVILDYTEPSVSFSDTDYLETNSIIRQTVTITDTHPVDSEAYQVPSGIASYLWEQLSGPGTLTFYSDSAGTTGDSSVEQPYIKAGASDGSEDGSYEIKVTATDNAGNSSYNIVDFVWDTVDPADVGTLTAYNQDDTVLNTSASAVMAYTSSAIPYIVWAAADGADFYTTIPYYQTLDPNTDPGVAYGVGGWYPHWDDDEVDWDNTASYENKNYMRSDIPYISAPTPANLGDNDGPVYFYVTAWDNAGNRANRSGSVMVEFWIDTLPPVIEKLQDISPKNSSFTIKYYNDNDTGDGRAYDQKTADDPDDPGSAGSGIASYLWVENKDDPDSPDKLEITNADQLIPTVSAADDGSEDGQYEMKLTVTDMAGNSADGYVSFEWDTTPPSSPVISGISHTPNVAPTWSWYGTGNGNGTFRYRLERVGRYWESDGGAYYGSSSVIVDWTETTSLSFEPSGTNYPGYPSSALSDEYEYTMYVQERDAAGNWSASGSRAIWIDTDFTSEPALNREGEYLRNSYGTARQVTWNWSTGLGNPATERYRYRLLDSSSAEVTGWTTLADDVTTLMIDFSTYDGGSPLDDDVYTIEVEEYNISDTSWVGKVASSTVQIDATAPGAPVMYTYSTGYSVTSNGYHLSNDTTPYFRWSSGGGGNGSYRWSFDESSWTYTTSIAINTSNSEGVYTFYVQESDTAGNWSNSATWALEIDTTAPTLSSILLSNRSTNAVNSTSYTVSQYVDIAITGSGSNSQTYTGNDIRYMRFWNSGGSTLTYVYNSTLSSWNFTNGNVTLTDGTKYVYCELIDYAGNVSISRYDSIVLDTAEPTVSSFSINSGSTVASSTSATLNSSYSGANYMRISNDGGSSWSGWYSASSSMSWSLSTASGYSGYGSKKVIVQFSDYAGVYSRNSVTQEAAHYTEVSDAIFYGTPVMNNSYKGYTKNGYIRTHYEEYGNDTSSSNTYYVYYATSPTGTKYTKGSTVSTASYSDYYTEGVPYYLFIRVYNPEIGYTNYSSYSLGYSSDMTIIYDDDDPDDTDLASLLKSRITTDWVSANPSYVFMNGSYTWTEFTVTMIPEDEVPATFKDDGVDETVIYGDPIIITPSAANLYASTTRAKNVAYSGHGVMGMHYYGWRFFQTLVNNWTSLGLNSIGSGVAPTDLDYAYSKGDTQYANIKPYSSAYDYIWHRYMYYKPLYDSYLYTEDYDALMFTSTTGYPYSIAHRWSLYNSNSSGTNGTYFYADDPDYSNYYTVVRQNRFVYWAYDKVPGYYYGIPFLYNIVRYLNYYY